MKELEVSAAVLVYQGKILCVQRGEGKFSYISFKYEFPGGKVEKGENPKEALRRELMEEMEVDIEIFDMRDYLKVDHEYPDFKITMYSFLCPMKSGAFTLNEHIDYKWMGPENLNFLDWAPADWPIVAELMKKGL